LAAVQGGSENSPEHFLGEKPLLVNFKAMLTCMNISYPDEREFSV
jgi:hypothetical protein